MALVAERGPARSEPSYAGRTTARGAARARRNALRILMAKETRHGLEEARVRCVGRQSRLGCFRWFEQLVWAIARNPSARGFLRRPEGFRGGLASVGLFAERDPQLGAPVGCQRQALLGQE